MGVDTEKEMDVVTRKVDRVFQVTMVMMSSIVIMMMMVTGRHNLRSFLAENSTQNYFLIARMFSFCDIRDKNAVFNILRQNVTNFDIGNG